MPVSAIAKNNETDRLALLEFKAKIIDDPLGVMSSWNSSVHFCQWYGVKCGRRHQRVTVLDLNSLKLSGSISPYIGNLSFLRNFYLFNNSFSHEIPPQIGLLQRLQTLSLFNNLIGGQIPSSISNCSNLVLIYLQNNIQLEGEIPVGLGSLLKLKVIHLENNNLIGTLSPSLGNLSSLEQLFVGINQLHGNLPHSLGQLKNLKKLAISENMFSGTIPPSIFNLSSIEGIDMSINNLQGNLPLGLGISLPLLFFFSIAYNKFTGSIPTSISNASSLEIVNLSDNNLTGTVPSFEKLHRLYHFNIALNDLGSVGKLADELKFLSTLSNATTLRWLSIGSNNFGGELPQQIGNLSKKLEEFTIQENQIFGNIPAGLFSLESLQTFYTSENKLSGTIPFSIGKLQNLQELSLEYNNFFGSIPSSLGNLTNLYKLYLSGNNLQGIIPWALANCKKLTVINLSRNNLSGSIPPKVIGLSSSIYFGLDQNQLSGSIPIEVGILKNLQTLDLHDNMLSGDISSSLGSCTNLEFLFISGNKFQGSIPSSLSSLRGIVELNVSHNNLSGKIPDFLNFKFIQILDLSYNDFVGMVPIEGAFKNASITSVEGNKNLCGGIPDFRLPACKFEQSKKRLTVKLKIIISVVSVVIGATLVLVCLFVCHLRKRKGQSTSTSQGKGLLKLSYQSLLKATDRFSSDNLIGTGSFGSVYKGILDQEEGIVIAVKVLNLFRHGASKSFLAECAAIKNIRHRNLVKVLTACSGVDYHGNDFKALVYEFMVNGSLDNWLHPTLGLDEERRTLNVLQRLNIAIDVACALEYLHHHCEKPIVHCDLKPSNILLDEEMTAHLSDFGLVKFLSNEIFECSANQSSSIGLRGTIGYCPPEYGVGSKVSTSGDIFSFGILLLEMFTGKRPTDDIFKEGLSLHNFVKRALPEHVTQVIDSNLLQMQINDDATLNHNKVFGSRRKNTLTECLISIFEIGIFCSVESPQERMIIGDIVAQLSSVRTELLGNSIIQGGRNDNKYNLAGAQDS